MIHLFYEHKVQTLDSFSQALSDLFTHTSAPYPDLTTGYQVCNIYSYRKLSTGFAIAARIACQLTVKSAINKAANPAYFSGKMIISIQLLEKKNKNGIYPL